MYESKSHALISRSQFLRRVLAHVMAAMGLLAGSLFCGMLGYEHFENLPWRDAFLNAAMLLGGMGPVNAPVTDAGKLFAGFYALYAGLVFMVMLTILFTPFIHRILHAFHWEENEP